MSGQKKNTVNLLQKLLLFLSPLVIIYLSISLYFTNHFYYNSVINGINVSGQTIKEADNKISSELEAYTLQLHGRGNLNDEIKGQDIKLNYNSNGELEKLKKSQNPFTWFLGFLNKNTNVTMDIISYNEDLLNQYIDNLTYFNSENIVEPQDATFECKNNKYNIVNEVVGTKINKEVLNKKIKEAIKNGDCILDLEELGCYENPKYTKDSPKVIETKDKLNSMIDFTVTYNIGDRKEVVDGDIISDWINVEDNLEINIDEGKVKEYVYRLASKYNTFGSNRNFVTTDGSNIKVSGGNYGWIINQPKEVQELMDNLKENKSIEREPIYSQTAVSREENDIGNTYVEIDMSKQHMWFYKEGILITEGDVVTGNASNNWSTPVGTYRLNYRERNATLIGEDYSSSVNFWLPFNGNIGIHDATWRNEFGGEIYLTNGSHGCVNAPYEVAEAIFNNIEAGTPIICYY